MWRETKWKKLEFVLPKMGTCVTIKIDTHINANGVKRIAKETKKLGNKLLLFSRLIDLNLHTNHVSTIANFFMVGVIKSVKPPNLYNFF